MFGFFSRKPVYPLTPALQAALATSPLPDGVEPHMLMAAEQGGQYSGRKVTYIRIFDALRARTTGVAVRSHQDLDQHLDLVVRSGHVERDGSVVLLPVQEASAPPTPSRLPADRTAHAEDEYLVAQDGTTS